VALLVPVRFLTRRVMMGAEGTRARAAVSTRQRNPMESGELDRFRRLGRVGGGPAEADGRTGVAGARFPRFAVLAGALL
jgi:hypothetical protein